MECRGAVQGQVCGRGGRGKSKVGLQKQMGIATQPGESCGRGRISS